MTKRGSAASMTMPPARAGDGFYRGARRAAMVVAMAGSLAACAQSGTTEERMGSTLVSPGKYRFYSCEHLARQTVLMKTREVELEALIAKAGPGAGGSFVSAIAYRPEYLQVRGNLVELRKEQAEKNCLPAPAAAPVPPAAKPRARPKR